MEKKETGKRFSIARNVARSVVVVLKEGREKRKKKRRRGGDSRRGGRSDCRGRFQLR